MKLILCDINKHLCEEWGKLFYDTDVQIFNGSFENIPRFDCIVSPANSFGLMDGGFDGALIQYFGANLMKRVQEHIIKEYVGEQPVGTSFIIATNYPEHKYLAHTPTMRVPKDISNNDNDNVYVAMRAMLIEVLKHPEIETVICPGLGTLTGRVPAEKAAYQMWLAYDSIMNPPTYIDWDMAINIENELNNI